MGHEGQEQVNVDEVKAVVLKVNVTYCSSGLLANSDIIQSDKFGEVLNIFTLIINSSYMNNTYLTFGYLWVVLPLNGQAKVGLRSHQLLPPSLSCFLLVQVGSCGAL